MKFQVTYYKKGNLNNRIHEEMEFKNEAAFKRWYKKEHDAGKMEFASVQAWNVDKQKPVHYCIFSHFRKKINKTIP